MWKQTKIIEIIISIQNIHILIDVTYNRLGKFQKKKNIALFIKCHHYLISRTIIQIVNYSC